MSRSKFSSTLEWFRTGDLDEVVAVLPLCVKAVSERTAAPAAPAKRVAKQAAPKQRSHSERSAAAKAAWEKRRLNAANSPETGQEVTQ